MQAVILAGGKGTRLAERLMGRPKPLIEVGGVPLLERQIGTLKANGVISVVILVNHAADQIRSFCKAHQDFGISLQLIDDGAPRGTAGAVLACLDELDRRFLVVYGDTLFDIDISRMITAHDAMGADASLLLHPNDHPADSDLVVLDPQGWIVGFHSYPHDADAILPNLVNAAFYIVEKNALLRWRDLPTPSDFAKNLFPMMATAGARLFGYRSFEYIKDVGTPNRLDKAEQQLALGVPNRARADVPQACVFLDRDGTLNIQRDYVRRPEDLILLEGVSEAVRRLNAAEFRTAVITNQPILARGECTETELRRIHDKLDTELGRQGAYIDGVWWCPHHPDGGFLGEVSALKVDCECRKPATGLIDQAARALNVDRTRSWMIGDSTADLLAARRAGLSSIVVNTGEGGRDGKFPIVADFAAADMPDAVGLILDRYPLWASMIADLTGDCAPGDVILVGGLARAGKSTLAATLERELRGRGLIAMRLSLDAWIRPAEGRGGGGVAHRFELDEALASLSSWFRGLDVRLNPPFYDRLKRVRRLGEPVTLGADTILILEGVPALLLAPQTDRRIHRVYVDACEPARARRVMADLVQRGQTEADAVAEYDRRQADEAAMVTPTRSIAGRIYSFDGLSASRI